MRGLLRLVLGVLRSTGEDSSQDVLLQDCEREDCPVGVHYHWGWGQRHSSLTPVTGPNSFSTGQPFLKRER
jgi:hypothetical protein